MTKTFPSLTNVALVDRFNELVSREDAGTINALEREELCDLEYELAFRYMSHILVGRDFDWRTFHAGSKPRRFEQWFAAVDSYVWDSVGCSIHDLPDCTFRDWYDDGRTARSAAAAAIKELRAEYGNPARRHF